eukprot:SAG25_NODE_4183_length_869_cov_102.544156_1_plen_50_part_01
MHRYRALPLPEESEHARHPLAFSAHSPTSNPAQTRAYTGTQGLQAYITGR